MTIKLITKCIPVCLLAILSLAISCATEEGGERSTAGETPKQAHAKQQANSSQSMIHSVVNKTSSQKQFMPPDREKEIAAIRKEFARLQPLLDDLPQETYEYEAENEPYSESTHGWKENGEWVKISFEGYGDHGGTSEDFYLKDGKLFFYYRTDGSYYYAENASYSKIEEKRLYFAGERLIYQLEKKAEFHDQKAEMDRVPNEEIALPADPTKQYQSFVKSVETHIEQIRTQSRGE